MWIIIINKGKNNLFSILIIFDLSYIAVDIGATNIRVALGNEEGIKQKIVQLTNKETNLLGIPQQIIEMIKELSDNPKSIGIGSIGPLNMKQGIITNTPNHPLEGIPIVKPLKEVFNADVTILNDCAAAVFGEQIFGAGKGLTNLFYVTLSTGIGGGAIVDNHLLKGKDGNAVEIGHIIIDPNSELICGCGGKGHWEALASGKNIPKYAELLIKNKVVKPFNRYNEKKLISTESLFKSAKKGNKLSLKIINEVGKINLIGFADVINMFDPELVTVGGSIALKNPKLILDPILSSIDDYLINRKPTIKITPLGEDVVLYGALALALETI